MEDEELSQEQVDDSLAEQGFAAEYGSDRWVSDLESQFATDDDDPVGAEEVAEEVAVGGGDSQAADGDTPAPGGGTPDYVQLGDVRVPRDEAERVARFWDWMNTNPDEAMQFVGYMSGEYDLVPKGQETAPQPQAQPSTNVDEEDPYEDWDLLPDSVQERLKKVDKLEGYLAAQHKQQQSVVQQQNLKSVETAQAQFANTYDLNSNEVARLADEAARLNIVPALVQETGDPVRAVERALEIVYLQSEQGRDREFNKRMAQTESDRDKQRKMAAVGGTAGSVPRREPDSVPGNATERRSAMVNEIAAALGKVT